MTRGAHSLRRWIHATTAAAATSTLLWARNLLACPLCASRTGEQVWAGIFDGHFYSNLLATAAPFVVFVLVGRWAHGGTPRASRRARGGSP